MDRFDGNTGIPVDRQAKGRMIANTPRLRHNCLRPCVCSRVKVHKPVLIDLLSAEITRA
jgi:hypothetical protein